MRIVNHLGFQCSLICGMAVNSFLVAVLLLEDLMHLSTGVRSLLMVNCRLPRRKLETEIHTTVEPCHGSCASHNMHVRLMWRLRLDDMMRCSLASLGFWPASATNLFMNRTHPRAINISATNRQRRKLSSTLSENTGR